MICCYLLFSGIFTFAEDSLNYYGFIRTEDGKGVTIASQIRFVKYFSRLLRMQKPLPKKTLTLKRIELKDIPTAENLMFFRIYSFDDVRIYGASLKKSSAKDYFFEFDEPVDIIGEIRIEIHRIDFTKVVFF